MNKIKNHEASRERFNDENETRRKAEKKLNEKESGAVRKESTHHYHHKHIIKIIIKTFMNDVLYKRLKETRDRLLYTMNKHE
jgi:hypothetical protein